MCDVSFFLLVRQPPPSPTRTDTLVPSTTVFRAGLARLVATGLRRLATVPPLRSVTVATTVSFTGMGALPVVFPLLAVEVGHPAAAGGRSEEHTSELQSLMRISYAVFCLKKKHN